MIIDNAKKRLFTAFAISIFLISALFLNGGNAASQTIQTVQANGVIVPDQSADLTVILRAVCITDLNPNQINIGSWVDSFVENHPYVTAITLADLHQYGVWWYGYSFSGTSGTWMGWRFDQLKTMIDRFHDHGWKVGLETTGIAWYGQQEYDYLTNNHPELSFTDANGLSATGVDNAAQGTKNPGYNNVIPDFFAKFATADTQNNIPAGTRLIDLYTARLKQMIFDGLQWDFWYGTDGWNGFTNQGYYWNTKSPSNCYSFSAQEMDEYAKWVNAKLPNNWYSMNNIQKANAIINNSTIHENWWYYWQIRFAQMYAQIKQVFIDSARPGPFYVIGSADESSEPKNSGTLSAAGMYNLTLLADFNAVDYVYVDQEITQYTGATYALGREQAYVGALAKMQDPRINPIIGLQPVDWLGKNYPLWAIKQEYLAQAVNYVWHNGTQYRVSLPNVVMLQYPNSDGFRGWTKQETTELFDFIEKTAGTLYNSSPAWLGPLVPIPDTKSGSFGMAWWGMNYSFAQWAWTANLKNNPSYVSPAMGTILLDEALGDSGPTLTGLYDVMVNQLWATDRVNLWYYENRGPASDWGVSTVWSSYEIQAGDAFHITRSSVGNSLTYTLQNNVADSTAKAIIDGYEGTSYSITSPIIKWYSGVYLPKNGFTTIASFNTDNAIAAGYFKNATTGNFLLTHLSSQPLYGGYAQLLPRSVVNRMLYWVSDCPVTSSESLLDLKILKNGATVMMPMTNQKDVANNAGTSDGWAISSTISINASALGLGNPADYNVYWAASGTNVQVTGWNSLVITLIGMADTLVISPL